MSKYTTQVRYICEAASGLSESAGYTDVKKIIEAAAPKIFTDYPIYDEDKRLELNCKILGHYYLNEIAHETVGQWKFRLNQKMFEIMPYFNQLYAMQSEIEKLWETEHIDVSHTGKSTEDISDNSHKGGSNATTETGSITNTNSGDLVEKRSGSDETINKVSDTTTTNTTFTPHGTQTKVEMGGTTSTQSSTSKTGGSDTTTSNQSSHSDTPQGAITGLASGNYMSDADMSSGTSKTTNSETDTSNSTVSNSGTDTTTTTPVGNDVTEDKVSQTAENSTTTKYGSVNTKTDNRSATESRDTKSETSFGEENSYTRDRDASDLWDEKRRGYSGISGYELMEQAANSITNVDLLVIDALEPLFLQIW